MGSMFDFNNKVKMCPSKLLTVVPIGTGVSLHEEHQSVSQMQHQQNFIIYNVLMHVVIFIVIIFYRRHQILSQI